MNYEKQHEKIIEEYQKFLKGLDSDALKKREAHYMKMINDKEMPWMIPAWEKGLANIRRLIKQAES